MNVGGAIFFVFMIVLMCAGIGYIAITNAQQAPITDTYGNTLGNTTNTSQNLTATLTQTPGINVLIILAAVIAVITVLFGFYIASKVFMT